MEFEPHTHTIVAVQITESIVQQQMWGMLEEIIYLVLLFCVVCCGNRRCLDILSTSFNNTFDGDACEEDVLYYPLKIDCLR